MKYKVTALPSYNDKLDKPFTVGDIVYKLRVPDYGSAETDSELQGTECISVTYKTDGDYPFQTIPLNCLEPIYTLEYTRQLDSLVSSVGSVLSQVTMILVNHLIATKQVPEPKTQEEIDKLGHEKVVAIALLAVTRTIINPRGLLYDNEIIPLLEKIGNNTKAVESLIQLAIQDIIDARPEGTPPPTVEPEEEDPIIKAQQGRSSIIIPGVNDK